MDNPNLMEKEHVRLELSVAWKEFSLKLVDTCTIFLWVEVYCTDRKETKMRAHFVFGPDINKSYCWCTKCNTIFSKTTFHCGAKKDSSGTHHVFTYMLMPHTVVLPHQRHLCHHINSHLQPEEARWQKTPNHAIHHVRQSDGLKDSSDHIPPLSNGETIIGPLLVLREEREGGLLVFGKLPIPKSRLASGHSCTLLLPHITV